MPTSEIPTLLWMIIRNFFQRDVIMDVTSVNHDDTLNLREWKGEDHIDYEKVAVIRNPFTKIVYDKQGNKLKKTGILEVNIGERVIVSFIDGSKDSPIVIGIIQGTE